MERTQKTANHERALEKLPKSTAIKPEDLEAISSCADRGALDLASKPRPRLGQMSTKKEDEALVLQDFKWY